jgi:O-antigen/teichoic acid export membrane protein
MSKLKRLAGETMLYGLGSMLPRMLNFALVPLHTYTFSKEQYGDVTKIFAVVGVLNVIYMFGMETAFFRFSTKEGADPKKVFNLAQTCVLLISLPLSFLFIVFSSPIATYLDVGKHPEFVTWLTLIMLTDAVVAIPFAQLRLKKKALQFAVFKIINVLFLVGLNYYFLKIAYDPALNVGYIFLANLMANALFIFFFLKTLLTWRPAYDREITPAMLRYSYPIMLTGVAGGFNELFSRFSLDWWLPDNFYLTQTKKEAVGVFGACYKYAVFMNLGIMAFRYAAEPFFFSNAADKNSPTLFARINHYFVICCCTVLLGVSLNLDLLKYFVGEDYWVGLPVVPVLLLSYLFLGVYYNFSVWFKLTDKTYYATWITVFGVIMTFLFNLILIPVWGYMGSSWASVICYGSMALVCYWFGQKYYPIPYRILASMLYIISAFLISAFTYSITFSNLLYTLLFHNGIIIAFILVTLYIERDGLRKPVAR